MAVIFYTIQIYAEFSGCMDIVRGVAQILGINMAENFKRPFFSKSVQEFWRRWHITLGAWLKDYIFYSVSFSNATVKLTQAVKKVCQNYIAKLVPAFFALFFVWFGNGIWHGASWKYIFYGLYYYIIMSLGMICEPLFKFIINKLKINVNSKWYQIMQMLRTTGFVLVGMLIFRSHRLRTAWRMFSSMFKLGNIGMLFSKKLYKIGMNPSDFVLIAIGVIIMFIVSLLQEKGVNLREKISKCPIVIRWGIYYIAIFAVIIFGIYGPGYSASSFIYGQF
jgi:D-alanyl-lipoteichoic acid acyltransferase DltB (MBOAT superfamily)